MPTLAAKDRAALPNSAFAYIDSAGKRALPIHDEAGRPAGFMGFAFDVSARVSSVATDDHPWLSAEALRGLSERLEQMREEERTLLARELHDELGQLLTGGKLDFSAAIRRLRELKTP